MTRQGRLELTVTRILIIISVPSEKMRPAVLLLLSAVCFSSAFIRHGFTGGSALNVLKSQVNAVLTAVKEKDKNTMLKLFHTDEGCVFEAGFRRKKLFSADAKQVDQLIAKLQGVGIDAVSAEFMGETVDGTITVTVDRKTSPAVKMHLRKSSESPTGWKADGVQEPPASEKRKFSMCWVGLFWCVIEVIARTADNDW